MLLAQELRQYVQYCEERVQQLQQTVSAVTAGQRPLVEVLGAVGVQSSQRYFCASAFSSPVGLAVLARLPQGVCALLRAAIAEYSKHISMARRLAGEHQDIPAAAMQGAAEVQHGASSDDDSIMSDDSEASRA